MFRVSSLAASLCPLLLLLLLKRAAARLFEYPQCIACSHTEEQQIDTLVGKNTPEPGDKSSSEVIANFRVIIFLATRGRLTLKGASSECSGNKVSGVFVPWT